jgi:hypothetical protein
MSNTPETEVLRISGNVMLLPGEDVETAKHNIEWFLKQNSTNWSGSIVPQDDPSGMRLYPVEEVEGYKFQIAQLVKMVDSLQMAEANNDINLLTVSEELAQERDKNRSLTNYSNRILMELGEYRIKKQQTENENLIGIYDLRERTKNTRWRTIIKWWKELWKKH